MATAIGSILRAASRRLDEPLNILTAPTHERHNSNLARTGHNFWMMRGQWALNWKTQYAPLPANCILLNPNRGRDQLPPEIDFDLVLIQNKAGQYQHLKPLADYLHLPTLVIEHCVCGDSWSKERVEAFRSMRGDINVFISAYSRDRWGFTEKDSVVIEHGIDSDQFRDEGATHDSGKILSVVNDWKNRNAECGFVFWQEATKSLPVFPLGDTPGLSKPAVGVDDLVNHYRAASVFVNTSQVSPIPMSLLEAMSCGCCVVSTATCAIPEVIQHGVNGLLAKTPQEMNDLLRQCLRDKPLRERLGREAARTIREKYSLQRFVERWDALLRKTANLVYTGK